MFVAWSFLGLNIILALFQALLVSAVGAILAIYSKYGDEYANSIRWVRQGGYFEMYNTLVNSRNSIPRSTKLILIITIVVSIIASLSDIGAIYFIEPSEAPSRTTFIIVKTTQYVVNSGQYILSGWNTATRGRSDIVDAIKHMINDTANIPGYVPGLVYTPRTTKYEIGCDKIAFQMWDGDVILNTHQDSCATANFTMDGIVVRDYSKMTVIRESSSRISISVLGQSPIFFTEMISTTSMTIFGEECGLLEAYTNSDMLADGISSLPVTQATKCILPTGEIIVISSTAIRFFVADPQLINITTSTLFHEENELVKAMETTVMKESFTKNSTLLVELRAGDSSLDASGCFSNWNTETNSTNLACMYINFKYIITKAQKPDKIIAAARGNAPWPKPVGYSSVMAIQHLPTITYKEPKHLSIAGAKDATKSVADYVASLGQNFFVDFAQRQLLVLYDSSEYEKGFDIPDWLAIGALCTMVVCAIFYVSTQYFLDPRYTGSLYKVMSIHLADKYNSYAQMIRWSKVYSMQLDEFSNAASNDDEHQTKYNNKSDDVEYQTKYTNKSDTSLNRGMW
ncbi:hypothetical protein BX616_006525 [Lobosporangium transversale]|uniref:Transmembrane protein n=1 Tax=Lobosporangium transversale TaxID=64571 RepID=A0A1Y2GPL8_9FUNG|nr:hypothetical protein BCR41DRAFT_352005 [Lobosporangium transversale]KAF9915280.1 hypothetical protein BX616_006525 [Lobosporangium transversale]ORZ18231.1 hypothetical protein BCR41DRAFT_352005 [Lobosporangium transversale]|eukprot:XP_021882026.1 hypothetical protein BCR41DRAFT_352005 [Lobosporangium transversale]